MGNRTSAAAIAVALAAGFTLSAHAQAPASKSIKVQSSWPASLTIQDHLRIIVDRIDKLTGGALKVEALSAGQVVPRSRCWTPPTRR